ncbi:hypothetical protein ACP3TB_05525 [Rahnella variigena]|uniref:hypothetical protein n=1 Tax=Rahnella variigena TaxID=574964 RepID=UPI003CE8CFF9
MKIMFKTFLIGLSSIIGVTAALYGVYFGFYPNSPNMKRKDDIIGTWTTNYSYSYNDKGIIVTVKDKTSYFSNGKYNISGKMSYQAGEINTPDIYVSYLINGAGEWVINDKELVISLNNLKSTPEKFIYKGESIELKNLFPSENITHKKPPRFEDMIANGASQSYKILIDKHNSKTLEIINPFGKNFNIIIYREK